MRNSFACLQLVSVSVLLCLCAIIAPAQAQRDPNFLILLADDLGYGDLGCFGHPTIKTPNLDKLAAEGLKLTGYYAGAPVCSPSRAALMTGRVPQRDGIYDWIPLDSKVHLPRYTPTIVTSLKVFGYQTALAGKWHLNGKLDGSQPTPGDHGFAHWFATQNNAEPTHENPVNFVRNGAPAGKLEGYSSTLIVNEAIDWLKQRKRDKPFFLYLPFHSPHERVATADEFVRQYVKAENAEQAQYFGNVTQLDHEIGRLLKTLDELGLSANTFVFFASDNGPETLKRYLAATRSYGSPGPLRGMKLHLYEGGIRVPGIVRWPGVVKAGRVSDEPVCAMDLLPTIHAITGITLEREDRVDGVSVLPLLQGRSWKRTAAIYWQYDKALTAAQSDLPAPKVALREGDWKILAHEGFKTFELYNVRLDPRERNELSLKEMARAQPLLEKLKRTYNYIKAQNEMNAR